MSGERFNSDCKTCKVLIEFFQSFYAFFKSKVIYLTIYVYSFSLAFLAYDFFIRKLYEIRFLND